VQRATSVMSICRALIELDAQLAHYDMIVERKARFQTGNSIDNRQGFLGSGGLMSALSLPNGFLTRGSYGADGDAPAIHCRLS
jgi:hypothetical protein